MRRAISILLVWVLCLSMCACSAKSNEIKLTTENYDDYLKITMNLKPSKDIKLASDRFRGANGTIYSNASFSSYLGVDVSVEGVSSNFLYSDIEIVVRANGSHLVCDSKDGTGAFDEYDTSWQSTQFEHTIKCNLDISGVGRGESEEMYYIPNDLLFPTAFAAGGYDFDFEIISISGKVTRTN